MAAVSKRTGSRLRKRCGIEPLLARVNAAAPWIAHLLSPFGICGAIAHIALRINGNWKAATNGHNRIGHPVTEYLAENPSGENGLPRSHRDLPCAGDDRIMANVRETPAFIEAHVIEI